MAATSNNWRDRQGGSSARGDTCLRVLARGMLGSPDQGREGAAAFRIGFNVCDRIAMTIQGIRAIVDESLGGSAEDWLRTEAI